MTRKFKYPVPGGGVNYFPIVRLLPLVYTGMIYEKIRLLYRVKFHTTYVWVTFESIVNKCKARCSVRDVCRRSVCCTVLPLLVHNLRDCERLYVFIYLSAITSKPTIRIFSTWQTAVIPTKTNHHCHGMLNVPCILYHFGDLSHFSRVITRRECTHFQILCFGPTIK